MLIILEGVDGAGKSTLVEQLHAATRATDTFYGLHFSQPRQHPLAEYEHSLDFYHPCSGEDVICDRFHWGEMIYGDLYRGGSQLGAAGFWHVEQYLRSRGGLMVHVAAPLEVVKERLERRGEDYLQSHHIEHVWTEFARWRHRSYNAPLIAPSPAVPLTVDKIIAEARHRERNVRFLRDYTGYVGPIAPRTLLIGERPNVKAKTVSHAAPFLPYPNTAASYLIDHVILQSDDPASIGLVNAFKRDGSVTQLRDLWRRLNAPRVVALGVAADRACNKLDVPHDTAPHPQFWRRFHHHEPERYHDLVLLPPAIAA